MGAPPPDPDPSPATAAASEPRGAARDETAGPRTAVVGTSLAVRQLCHTLAAIDHAPHLVGCVVPDRAAAATLPVPVLGLFDELDRVVALAGIGRVLISLPLHMHAARREAELVLDRLGVPHRFMPTLGDQLAGRLDVPTASPPIAGPTVSVTADPVALLERAAHPLDDALIRDRLAGRRVLVTGAGGSIGSELARAACRFGAAELLLLERGENALFEIDRELARVFPQVPRRAVLHDVTQRDATAALCDKLHPQVVFHAAAHKHVPMMEDHPAAAVENNFYGTRSIADAAAACGAERFVMISTDKAVNPSSVMGATKRLAELYVQHLDRQCDTTLCMVRFGNVLGSACSVLPIWTRQLQHGGPVTVTHADMTRYFMTIPEAAGLVLQAGALASGGEVFLLDMGRPIRILDLAARFCRLHGREPGLDIDIQITGPRPGEKLFEELAYTSEDMAPTDHASVRVWRTTPPTPARLQQITTTLDKFRRGAATSHAASSRASTGGDREAAGSPSLAAAGEPHPWRNVEPQSVTRALRSLLPEMTAPLAAAG